MGALYSRDSSSRSRCDLVLIEILPADRFKDYRSEWYPFIQAGARSRGLRTKWLVVGPGVCGRAHFVFDLAPNHRSALFRRLAELEPRSLFVNERLSEELWRELRRRHPDASMKMITEEVQWRHLLAEEHDLRLVEEIIACPEHDREVLLPESLEHVGFTHLMAGPECLYSRPLGKNPYFRDVDLSRCVHDRQCSFCCGVPKRPLSLPAEEVALRQVAAVEQTAPSLRRSEPREYVVHGAALWMRVDRFFKGLVAMKARPSAFFFSCRVDEILRMARRVESILPSIDESGHSINLGNVGLESFSACENERFNKGISRAQIEEVIELLHRWERDHPRSFRFSKHGGFGFITFTPWTRLEDLMDAVRGLEALSRRFPPTMLALKARLQLLPHRPLTELARRDGLLTEGTDDSPFDSGCITSWEEDEISWRFKNDDVATIYRISRRLAEDEAIAADDADKARIDEWLESEAPTFANTRLEAFRALVEELTENPGLCELDRILSGASRRMARRVATGPFQERLLRTFQSAPRLLAKLAESKVLGAVRVDNPRLVTEEGHPAIALHLVYGAQTICLFFQQKDLVEAAFAVGRELAVAHEITAVPFGAALRRSAFVLLRMLDELYSRC